MLDEGSGASFNELFTVAEAPEDGNTRKASIPGCLYIHLAVADVNGLRTFDLQFAKGKGDHVGGWFAADAFPFANSNVYDIFEICLIKFIDPCL